MGKNIKEQLDKLQYYGEFYAKSDIDDKIKLEELDKSGEIAEFGRNFSPQVDHKYTMVVTDRRSYLLGNGRGGKDFTNFLTTLEKLDNEKYLGLRESLETDPARYHLYTHRGDLLEAFDGVYDEELNLIGNNFVEVYNEVNEAIKSGEVDLTDYPDLERAFDDYELKLLDKEVWEMEHDYVKYYMDNAYEYLELWIMNHKRFNEKRAKESKVVLDEPLVQKKFKDYNIDYEYNNTTGNYDLYSRKLDYKDEKYKIISCDKKGKVDGYDLYLQDENSEFYNYVEDLQTIKSDSKYKNFNFEFNAERVLKVRELTKPASMEIEDKDDVDISEEQARFEAVIRKLSQPMLGLENKQYDGLER